MMIRVRLVPVTYNKIFLAIIALQWVFSLPGLCNLENFTAPSPQQGQCFCPGDKLTYQCTVVGGILTWWRGTMCDHLLVLLHDQFDSNTISACTSNANIIARSVSHTNNCYTSQLNVTATPDLKGRTVECTDENFNVIGNHEIKIASSLPSPTIICADVSEQREIMISWGVNASICGGARFNVGTSCPGCTNRTLSGIAKLTCVGVPTDGTTCVIRIQTETTLCGIPPSIAVEVNVILGDQPVVRTVPRYDYATGNLISINVTVSTTESFSIIDGFVSGSPVRYEVVYSNMDQSMSTIEYCENTTIPTTLPAFCEGSSCSVTFMLSSSSCSPSSLTSVNTSVTAVNRLGPGLPTEIQDRGSNTLFLVTLPQVLSPSNRTVTCKFFENYPNIVCQFFKYSPGSNCRQLELVDEESGIGNILTFQLDITLFHTNDTIEFVVRGSNQMKSIDIQGIINIEKPRPESKTAQDNPCTVRINEAVGITFVVTATSSTIFTAAICSVIIYYTMRRMNVNRKEERAHKTGGDSYQSQGALYEEVSDSKPTKDVIEMGENVSYGHINRR